MLLGPELCDLLEPARRLGARARAAGNVTLLASPPWGGMPIGVPSGCACAVRVVRAPRIRGGDPRRAGRMAPRSPLLAVRRQGVGHLGGQAPAADDGHLPHAQGRRALGVCPVANRQARSAPHQRCSAFDPGGDGCRPSRWPLRKVTVSWRGRQKDLLVWSRPVLWCSVDNNNFVLLVAVRDPEGVMHDDCVTRTQRRSRCRRSSQPMWCCARDGGVALRDRPAGGGPKPPQAAAVKSRGGERCGKGGSEPVRCEPRRRAEANHPMTGRKRIDGIKSGVESLPRDEPGGNLPTAQAVPGLKVARARFRLWHGTCEPASRYRPAVHWTPGPPVDKSETPKWQKPRGAE